MDEVVAKRDVSAALLKALEARPTPPSRARRDAAKVLTAHTVDADGPGSVLFSTEGHRRGHLSRQNRLSGRAAAAALATWRGLDRTRRVEGGVAELVKRLRSTRRCARAAKLCSAAADGDSAAETRSCGPSARIVAALEGDLSTAALQAAVDALHRLAAYDLPAGAVGEARTLRCLARSPNDGRGFKILRHLNGIMRQRSGSGCAASRRPRTIVCGVVADRAKHGGVASEGCFDKPWCATTTRVALGTCEGASARRAPGAQAPTRLIKWCSAAMFPARSLGMARRVRRRREGKGGALLAGTRVNGGGDARIVAQALTVLALVAAEEMLADALPGGRLARDVGAGRRAHADVRRAPGLRRRRVCVATDADVRGVLKDLHYIAAVITTGRDKAAVGALARAAAAAAALGFCKEAGEPSREAAPSTVHVLTVVAGDARVDASTVRHLVTALAAMEDDGFAQDVLYDDALRAARASRRWRGASPIYICDGLRFRDAAGPAGVADDALAAGAAEIPPRRSSRARRRATCVALALPAAAAFLCLAALCATSELRRRASRRATAPSPASRRVGV